MKHVKTPIKTNDMKGKDFLKHVDSFEAKLDLAFAVLGDGWHTDPVMKNMYNEILKASLHPLSEEIPTDEEIEKCASGYYAGYEGNFSERAIVEEAWSKGAKWALSMSTNIKESEWISVKDRLPEINQIVMAWLLHDDQYPVFAKYKKTGKFYIFESDAHETITHWQPLPTPPL